MMPLEIVLAMCSVGSSSSEVVVLNTPGVRVLVLER